MGYIFRSDILGDLKKCKTDSMKQLKEMIQVDPSWRKHIRNVLELCSDDIDLRKVDGFFDVREFWNSVPERRILIYALVAFNRAIEEAFEPYVRDLSLPTLYAWICSCLENNFIKYSLHENISSFEDLYSQNYKAWRYFRAWCAFNKHCEKIKDNREFED